MRKRTANTIFVLLFVACFALGFLLYQVFTDHSYQNNLTYKGTDQSSSDSSTNYKLADNIGDGVILQAWCWSFNTIKECMADIAYAGYTAVQTSPANECYPGQDGGMQLYGDGCWYYHYQPTDWSIGNYQLGTRDEFKAMCDEAEKYNIKIIVDVVPNHTASVGVLSKNLLDIAGDDIHNLYHTTATTSITNWGNRLECTMYAMTGLLDVNTENPNFQNYFINYLNDCIACGADGFRYDTAKHIALPDDPKQNGNENNFWTRVIGEITNADKIFNYGEVLQGDNERIDAYASAIGHVTTSSYGSKIRSSISSAGLIAGNLTSYSVGGVSTDQMVTWVESHDNYINDGTYKMSDDTVIYGWAIISSLGQGTPLFYSRPYGSTITNQWGTQNRIGVEGSDIYKDNRVVAVNRMHNACVGEPMACTNIQNSNSTVKNYKTLFIQRGTKGATIINMGESFSISEQTTLADGTYVDRVSNSNTFTVSNGVLTGTIEAPSIVVLCNDSNYFETEVCPTLGVADNTVFVIDGASTNVTLKVSNASNATYSINGGSETTYTDGQSITITPSSVPNETTKLQLKATFDNDLRTTTRTFIFTKKSN